MTKDGSFKKVVRRHAQDTGQRYTESLTDLEGVEERLFHEPIAERLVAHLREHHGIDAVAATKASQHNDHVFRVDRADGDPWIARVFPPARPRVGAEGDAAVLRFLERQGYPAERAAVGDAVSTVDGSAVLVTGFVAGRLLPSPAVGAEGIEKFAILGDLLGRLHALPLDDSVNRPGGASGEDATRAGHPGQDLVAALTFLDAVATKVTAAQRDQFEALRALVQGADDGRGLPEALVHGNLLHAPDHVIIGEDGPVAIQWKASGRGPRLIDVATLLWGTWLDQTWIDAAVGAYRRHIELTDTEVDRLEAVMRIRPLYWACFDWRRTLAAGVDPSVSPFTRPDLAYIEAAAAAARTALRR